MLILSTLIYPSLESLGRGAGLASILLLHLKFVAFYRIDLSDRTTVRLPYAPSATSGIAGEGSHGFPLSLLRIVDRVADVDSIFSSI